MVIGVTWSDFGSTQVSRFQVYVLIRYVINEIMSRVKYPDLSFLAAHRKLIFGT